MRRAQTVRHRPSYSVAITSDDLGLVDTGNKSIEEVLRQDLASSQQKNERLQAQVDALNAALKARPSMERVQELEKEFQSLELLLQGTQKENERAMAELERIKTREKMMERELRKFAGDDWEETLNVGPNISTVLSARSLIGTGSRIAQSSPSGHRKAEEDATGLNEMTLSHMEQIKAMLMGMSERLQSGEEKLQQAIEHAEREHTKLETILNN